MPENPPDHLYKIISLRQWQDSKGRDAVVLAPMDKAFIHLAKEDQTAHVIEKFWKGTDCVLLKLDTSKLSGRLVFETNPGGSTRYYHLYDGSIPANAILESRIIQMP
jgi:uncharacterized protein (DUF952 family)